VSEDRSPTAEQVVKLGVRLKRIREKSGMSLRAVARQLGVSPSFMSQLENGKSQPSVATLYSLTQLLDVSIEADNAAGSRGGSRTASVGMLDDRAAAAGGGSSISRSDLGSPADAWPREQALERLSVTRPGMRHRLEMDSGVIWEQLANNTGTGLDFIEVIYPPHASSTTDNRMLQHVGWEFGYLVEGELEITVGFEVFTMHTGEALGFDSATPHLLANKTDRVARGIWCVRHGYA
jgi:transcriptional regulator with XRE-family HTH domain